MDPVVVVSNRGPLSFGRDPDGNLVPRQAGGGLVSSLTPLVTSMSATWVAAALSDDERAAADQGLMKAEGLDLRLVDVDPARFAMAYDVVSNATLWFLHHGLFDLARRPRFDRHWSQAWRSYTAVNQAFADVVAEVAPDRATVLVQDYHLCLVPRQLKASRGDLRIVHFSHTPFTDASGIRVLPAEPAAELLEGMTAGDACGFHAERWARGFDACCQEVLGRSPTTFVAPLGPDSDHLHQLAAGPEVDQRQAWLDQAVGDRQMVLRVDRLEPSKNLVRGFLAYGEMLAEHPEMRQRVVFVALVYPSREGLAEYAAYRTEVQTVAERINRTWEVPGWTPVVLDIVDDFPRALAALGRYDVLFVNPVRDGLNLVAKEGPLLNTVDGVLALSREAGAWPELAGAALEINPFDVGATAATLHRALTMARPERVRRAAHLRASCARRTPRDWLDAQLSAGGEA